MSLLSEAADLVEHIKETLTRYKLLVFAAAVLAATILFFIPKDWVAEASGVLGILASLLAAFAWLEGKQLERLNAVETERQSQIIRIAIYDEDRPGDPFFFPIKPRRAEFSRAELQGLLGTLPFKEDVKVKRYTIPYIMTESYFAKINQILDSDSQETIAIPVPHKEWEKWNWDEVTRQIESMPKTDPSQIEQLPDPRPLGDGEEQSSEVVNVQPIQSANNA